MPLRPLKENDRATVTAFLTSYLQQHLDWWSAAYQTTPQLPLSELVERDWQELLAASDNPRAWVRVLELNGAVQGIVFAELQTERYMGVLVGSLSWIYVAETVRGKGAAKTLMAAVQQWFEAHDVAGTQVFVTAENAAAVALYQRFGYQLIDYRMLGALG